MSWTTAQVVEVYKRHGIPCAVQQACGDGRKLYKYHNQPVTIDGHRFDSTLEARHYQTLKIAAENGWISNLELQPRFVLQPKLTLPNGKTQRAIVYVGDFRFTRKDGQDTVVDSKGILLPTFLLKLKMFRSQYPLIDLQIWGKER